MRTDDVRKRLDQIVDAPEASARELITMAIEVMCDMLDELRAIKEREAIPPCPECQGIARHLPGCQHYLQGSPHGDRGLEPVDFLEVSQTVNVRTALPCPECGLFDGHTPACVRNPPMETT